MHRFESFSSLKWIGSSEFPAESPDSHSSENIAGVSAGALTFSPQSAGPFL